MKVYVKKIEWKDKNTHEDKSAKLVCFKTDVGEVVVRFTSQIEANIVIKELEENKLEK